jgi:hypothetical protein
MNQQINLFQPIFRKERKLLSFETMLQICAVVLIALAGLYAYGWWHTQQLNGDVARLQKQHQKRLAQLERVSREASKRPAQTQVQDEIARLQAELKAERYILSLLDGDEVGQATGFSEYLQIFTRRVVQGMWLKEFVVYDGGDHMLIRGGSVSADLVPKFLKGLSQEPQLQGMHFSVLQMARDKPNKSWIEFVLSSREIVEPLEQ